MIRGAFGLVMAVAVLRADPVAVLPTVPPPAPPAPPVVIADAPDAGPAVGGRSAVPAAGETFWSVGDPSDEEQLLLEIVNRARENPVDEAERLINLDNEYVRVAYDFYKVDLNVFRTAMAQFPTAQPLAFHPQLMAAALGHSQWMFDNALQSHEQGTVTAVDRINAAGYPWSGVAESIYASGYDMEHTHAGFDVDWGLFDGMGNPIPPGMQDPPGHRLNNHNTFFREVGIAVLVGNNTVITPTSTNTVGPRVVTMNFGTRPDNQPLVTGVAYFDLNQNGFYDLGEGMGGVEVTVSGSSSKGRTTYSGGYAVPSGDGNRTVTFSAPGMAPVVRPVVVSGGKNLKQDLVLAYAPPGVTGPATAPLGRSTQYVPATVPAADAFEWELAGRTVFSRVIGAETGQDRVTAESTPGYDVIQGEVRSSGSLAFHLVHYIPPAGGYGEEQRLTLTNRFLGGTTPVLEFRSMLGAATEVQEARAEFSVDAGFSWQLAWSRQGLGTNSFGQQQFEAVSVPLPNAAGKAFRVRFRYALGNGLFFPQDYPGYGWYIDDIRITGSDELVVRASGEVPAGTPVSIVPDELGTFALRVRPRVEGRRFPFGAPFLGEAVEGGPLPEVVLETPRLAAGMVEMEFGIGGAPGAIHLDAAPEVGGAWTPRAGAVAENLGGGRYRFRVAPSGASSVFRVRVE